MNARESGILWVLLLLPAANCYGEGGQDCLAREKQEVATQGYELALDGAKLCLGTDGDGSSSLATARKQLFKAEASVSERAKAIAQVLGELKGTAAAWSTAAASPGERQLWRTIEQALSREAQVLAQPYDTYSAAQLREWKALVFNPDDWQIVNDRVRVLPGTNLLDVDKTNCPTSPPEFDKCAGYSSRKELLRVIMVGYLLGRYIVDDERLAMLKRTELLDTQWTQYHEQGRFQWPWEHLVNGYRMERSSSKLCDRGEGGARQGFCRVPSDQLILLHPDVAFQWVDGASSSSDLHGAAYLEVFGRYSWKWDESGKMSRQRGWSAIALYSNLDGESEVGYGIMYHGKRANTVAVTVTDGRVGLLFSLALSDRLFAASDSARAKLKEKLESLKSP